MHTNTRLGVLLQEHATTRDSDAVSSVGLIKRTFLRRRHAKACKNSFFESAFELDDNLGCRRSLAGQIDEKQFLEVPTRGNAHLVIVSSIGDQTRGDL